MHYSGDALKTQVIKTSLHEAQMNIKHREATTSKQRGNCSFSRKCVTRPMRDKAELYEAAE